MTITWPPRSSCQCGGACKRSAQLAGLGAFDLASFAGGLSLPMLLIAAMVVYALLGSPGARARRRELTKAKKRYQADVAQIKQRYTRLPKYYET